MILRQHFGTGSSREFIARLALPEAGQPQRSVLRLNARYVKASEMFEVTDWTPQTIARVIRSFERHCMRLAKARAA